MARSAWPLRRSAVIGGAALVNVTLDETGRHVLILSRWLRLCRCRYHLCIQVLLLHEALEELLELVEMSHGCRRIVADARALDILVSNGFRHVFARAAVVVTDVELY